MESFMKEVGRGNFDRDMEFRFGMMVLVIKEIGIIIKQTVKGNSSTLMAIFMKDTG